MGRADVARDFANWYRGHLFDNGKVPCCVDFRGADPVPENDSQGEYIFLVNQLYRFTGDRAALERDWPSVLGATRYMDKLRRSERTAANRVPGKRMLYGLMPPSISHEGYSAKPQYSLWDDFWALRGYRRRRRYRAACSASPKRPRSPRRATSSRPTSTPRSSPRATIGRSTISPARPASAISTRPRPPSRSTPATSRRGSTQRMLDATFERYWTRVPRRAPRVASAWKDYTPYETRTIGSFVRLGWRDRIDGLIDFFMADRRPAGWNQWAEVVGRDAARSPLHRRHAACLGGVRFRPRRRSTCSPGTGATIARWCSAAGCRRLAGRRGLGDPRAGDALWQPRFRHARQRRSG